MIRTYSFLLITCAVCGSASATIFTGAGGRGVPVGSSSLIGVLDYSDTFTGTANGSSNPNRPYAAAVQPAAAYVIENNYSNPSVNLRSQSQAAGVAEFSFAADGPGTPGLINGNPSYPGTSGAGSATGITQTGGSVDYGVPYGLRTRYLVQFDAVAVDDRIDITSAPLPGSIFQANSLSVFIRGNGTGGVSLFNGTTDTFTSLNTGLPNDNQWHNYAVLFDQDADTIEVFVDEQSKGVVNLNTFAGGLYANFSNAAVGVGAGLANGEDRTWTDNFQVGAFVPEPSSATLLGLAAALTLRCVRKRRT